MLFRNHPFAVTVLASIILMAAVNLLGFALGIHDLFYLNDILAGKPVPESDHEFYMQKSEILYWASAVSYILFLICFLFWFYRAYKNVYVRETAEAPFKPAIVPFSFIIPIFNFYGPYQIMKFIWWGNAASVEHLYKGYRTIRIWWMLFIANFILLRVVTGLFEKAQYAGEFRTATYFQLFIFLVSLYHLSLTYKLVWNINQEESNRSGA